VGVYEQNCVERNYGAHAGAAGRVALLAERVAELESRLLAPRKRMKQLAELVRAKGGAQDRVDAAGLGEEIRAVEEEKEAAEEEMAELALALPNLTSPETPSREGGPRVKEYVNYDPVKDEGREWPQTADHASIGKQLGLIDFASAAKTAGWGFYYLTAEAALLEQALVQFALSVATKWGWKAVSPPSLVYSHVADACGFRPRDGGDEQQIWQVRQLEREAGKPSRSLAATAEIPLAGMFAGGELAAAELPRKLVGSSRCYRAEAGARGVDTRGLYRVHEFTKVEMVAWADPGPGEPGDDGWTTGATAVWDEMVAIQKDILRALDLPARVLEMPASDLGASAWRKVDVEVLFPSRRRRRDGGWGEVTSASICTDYQSRRLDTRVKGRDGKRRFVHTVNGTAMAVPRVLAALLEHGWREEGGGAVHLPPCLGPWMGGVTRIGGRGTP